MDDEDDDDDEENIKIPTEFYNKIKNAFNELYKNKERGINSKEEETVIIYLYKLYTQLKQKDFKNTNYSKLFFHKIKDVILKSAVIQKDLINIKINNFFLDSDKIYNRDIEEGKKDKKRKSNNGTI